MFTLNCVRVRVSIDCFLLVACYWLLYIMKLLLWCTHVQYCRRVLSASTCHQLDVPPVIFETQDHPNREPQCQQIECCTDTLSQQVTWQRKDAQERSHASGSIRSMHHNSLLFAHQSPCLALQSSTCLARHGLHNVLLIYILLLLS